MHLSHPSISYMTRLSVGPMPHLNGSWFLHFCFKCPPKYIGKDDIATLDCPKRQKQLWQPSSCEYIFLELLDKRENNCTVIGNKFSLTPSQIKETSQLLHIPWNRPLSQCNNFRRIGGKSLDRHK